MANASSWADVWMTDMMRCNNWPVEAIDPPMNWDDHPAHKPKPIKTSFPVLFIGNRADPVTPLYHGVTMARRFVDAGLIQQQSEGHCSLSAVSLCTIGKVKAYLRDGKVPPHPVWGMEGRELEDGKWDRCEADEWPWHPFDGREYVANMGEDAEADAEAMIASKAMQYSMKFQGALGQESGFSRMLLR